MDSVEATTKIIEAYLQTANTTLVRSARDLKDGALNLGEAFKTIYAAIEEAQEPKKS